MDEDLINKIICHLSEIRDKLVETSFTAFMIRRIAGAHFVQVSDETVSVNDLIEFQHQYMAYANDHIEQIRQILRTDGNTNLQGV